MEVVGSADEASGEYREMLIRLMTRQLYAETATAEVFGRSIQLAPTWAEKRRQAQFANEEATHSQTLVKLLEDLGEEPEELIASRPPSSEFWGLAFDDWLDVAVFNFTVDRAGSHQIMEYRQSSYEPWARSMGYVLEDEEEHYGSGLKAVHDLCADPTVRAIFQQIFDHLLPITIRRAFGRPESDDNEFCLRTGLKRASTYDVQARYLEEMCGFMEPAGLTFPSSVAFDNAGVLLGEEAARVVASLQRDGVPS